MFLQTDYDACLQRSARVCVRKRALCQSWQSSALHCLRGLMRPVNIAIVPGNGTGNVVNANWYGWLQRSLHNPPSVTCQLKNMPEPLRALESKWIPFMRDTLQCKEDTIIVGHSSGAAAAMRFAESYKVAGMALRHAVCAYTSGNNHKGYWAPHMCDSHARRHRTGIRLQ